MIVKENWFKIGEGEGEDSKLTFKKFKEDFYENNIEVNSFNKYPPALSLTYQDIDLRIEIPFWKVFRNKSIFKTIFSNFDNKLFSYRYLSNLKYLINNYSNAIEIVYDKLKCGNYQLINDTQDMVVVFERLTHKDNQFNRSILNLLFEIYSTPESFNNVGDFKTSSIIQFSDSKKWLDIILYIPNWVILDKYIKFFKIESNIVKDSIPWFPSRGDLSFNFEFINYLISNDYFKFSDIQYNMCHKLDYDFVLGNIKLKELFSKFKIITTLFKNHGYQYENNKINNLISEINQIDKKQLKKDELINSSVYDLLKSNSSTDIQYYCKNNSNSSKSTTTTTESPITTIINLV